MTYSVKICSRYFWHTLYQLERGTNKGCQVMKRWLPSYETLSSKTWPWPLEPDKFQVRFTFCKDSCSAAPFPIPMAFRQTDDEDPAAQAVETTRKFLPESKAQLLDNLSKRICVHLFSRHIASQTVFIGPNQLECDKNRCCQIVRQQKNVVIRNTWARQLPSLTA